MAHSSVGEVHRRSGAFWTQGWTRCQPGRAVIQRRWAGIHSELSGVGRMWFVAVLGLRTCFLLAVILGPLSASRGHLQSSAPSPLHLQTAAHWVLLGPSDFPFCCQQEKTLLLKGSCGYKSPLCHTRQCLTAFHPHFPEKGTARGGAVLRILPSQRQIEVGQLSHLSQAASCWILLTRFSVCC